MKSHKFSRSRKGFTLVEIMTATAIMLILILFATRIATDMLRIYNSSISSLTTNADSRVVLDPITEDFGSLYMPDDGKFWFEVRYDENDQGNLSGKEIPRVMFYTQARERVRKIFSDSGAASEEIAGTTNAICYRIEQASPFGDTITSPENLSYIFYRSILNSRDTLTTAMGYTIGNNSVTDAKNRLPSAFWKSSEQITDPVENAKDNIKDWVTDLQNFTCDGVVNLTFAFWYDDLSDGKRKIAMPANSKLESEMKRAYPDNDIKTFTKSIAIASDKIMFDDQYSSATSGTLRAIDVSLTLIDQAGRELLAAEQRQSNSGKISDDKFKEILRTNGVTFTRNIKADAAVK